MKTGRRRKQRVGATAADGDPSEGIDLTDGLPTVMTAARHLREKTRPAVEHLTARYDLYVRNNRLVRVVQDEKGTWLIQEVDEKALRGMMERSANFLGVDRKGNLKPVDPPLAVVRDALALSENPYPALQGIANCPILTPSGKIVTKPGYEPDTRLYYADAGLQMPDVPDRPTQDDCRKAADLLKEVVCDFPFADPEGQTELGQVEAANTTPNLANALAAMITPVVRPAIAGCVPLALLDKPQAGTGATLLAEVVSVIATGRTAALMSQPKDDEECEKRITAALLKGAPVIVIDNVEHRLFLPSLATALTSDTWGGRVLGESRLVDLPQRATWIATGNNIQLGGDLPRRCYRVRLDANEARPWERQGFKHPELVEWVRQERGRILAAMLTLAKAWLNDPGEEPKDVKWLGGFVAWHKALHGILAKAGVGGFLANLDELYDEMDEDLREWEEFAEALRKTFGKAPFTAKKVKETLQAEAKKLAQAKADLDGEMELAETPLTDALPGWLADEWDRPKTFTRKLGNAFAKKAGVILPSGYRIEKDRAMKSRAVQWRVKEVPSNGGSRK